ncbi:tyrosine recombinase : Marine sediment metagenome DNA, contig: S06H3_L02821 (Fragment) OS=marine sediment metagenome GN=S06H3_17168 PE=4 SV=1: HTH_17: Phage_integrase [Tuwongella immobilis]|uniref:Tyr recombinase domain-containing protein n=1 Tax=Tuwongella immobilis TaxID=692036 RepID=A0A6C2YJ22_9BACT
MPKPFKIVSTRQLPPNPEIVNHQGKPHIRLKDNRGRSTLFPLSQNQRSYLRPSKCWYFEFRDAQGVIRRKKGFTDFAATQQLALDEAKRVERMRSGILDPTQEHLCRPLSHHVQEFRDHLEAKGRSVEYVRLAVSRLTILFDAAGFVSVADVSASRINEILNAMRRGHAAIEIPIGESFAPGEIARLLGITPTAVSMLVRRHQLPATGNGKARRYPRSTVEALIRNRGKGTSPQTLAHYVTTVKSFFRWMVRDRRLGISPVDTLVPPDARADVRHARRELTMDELRKLLMGTRASPRLFRGLSGQDRYVLYLMAATTGFRVRALAGLTVADFRLDQAVGSVTLGAKLDKSKRGKVQPIPADVAQELRRFLSGKPLGTPIWGGTWHRKAAEMIRADLAAVGIPYSVNGPNGPEFADFHALRHSYLTLGGRSGIDLRTLQELAGHSTPSLTARYSHRRFDDLAGAVAKLPSLTNDPDDPANQASMSESRETEPRSGVVPGVVTGSIAMHSMASIDEVGSDPSVRGELTQPHETKQPGAKLHQVASNCNVHPIGFEPITFGSVDRCSIQLSYGCVWD